MTFFLELELDYPSYSVSAEFKILCRQILSGDISIDVDVQNQYRLLFCEEVVFFHDLVPEQTLITERVALACAAVVDHWVNGTSELSEY